MNASFNRLEDVENGNLILLLRDGTNYVGIKGFYEDTHLVVLLCSKYEGAPGPYTLMDIGHEWSVVTLGGDWIVDFDPVSSIRTDLGSRPPLGSMLIADSGLAVVTHNESGPHTYSLDGVLGPENMMQPIVTEWRILIRQCGDQYKEIYRWPEENGDE